MEIVINRCYGGFGLSKEAYEELGLVWDGYGYEYRGESYRTNPRLVAVVKKLGAAADGRFSNLKVVDIPDDVQWTIEEYDGIEWVAEIHRTWE